MFKNRMKNWILIAAIFTYCLGCQTNNSTGFIEKSEIRQSQAVVEQGLKAAFGDPVPFKWVTDALQPLFDPPQHLIEVRFQCVVSKENFGAHFNIGDWRQTLIPRSVAEQAPGFDYPTSPHIATSYERTVGEWDYRIIRAWESEEVLMIAIRSKDHRRYKANGLDY